MNIEKKPDWPPATSEHHQSGYRAIQDELPLSLELHDRCCLLLNDQNRKEKNSSRPQNNEP